MNIKFCVLFLSLHIEPFLFSLPVLLLCLYFYLFKYMCMYIYIYTCWLTRASHAWIGMYVGVGIYVQGVQTFAILEFCQHTLMCKCLLCCFLHIPNIANVFTCIILERERKIESHLLFRALSGAYIILFLWKYVFWWCITSHKQFAPDEALAAEQRRSVEELQEE